MAATHGTHVGVRTGALARRSLGKKEGRYPDQGTAPASFC
jgi:hypothetical protein